MNKTAQKHLDAIRAGVVERTNVIGLRKLINASERKAAGYHLGVTSCAVDWRDLQLIEDAIEDCKPIVRGDLHETGLKLLRSPRYAKRFAGWPQKAITALDHFRLAGFDRIGARGLGSVPVYQVWSKVPSKGDTLDEGTYHAFTFRNISWQSGGDGPEIQGVHY